MGIRGEKTAVKSRRDNSLDGGGAAAAKRGYAAPYCARAYIGGGAGRPTRAAPGTGSTSSWTAPGTGGNDAVSGPGQSPQWGAQWELGDRRSDRTVLVAPRGWGARADVRRRRGAARPFSSQTNGSPWVGASKTNSGLARQGGRRLAGRGRRQSAAFGPPPRRAGVHGPTGAGRCVERATASRR